MIKKILIILLLFPMLVQAISMSISPTRFIPLEEIKKGGNYFFDLTISNPNSEDHYFQLSNEYIQDQEPLEIPDSWIIFSPPQLKIQANSSREVRIKLRIPKKANIEYNQDYRTLLVAEIIEILEEGEEETSVSGVGVASGSILQFQVVGEYNFYELVLRWFNRLFTIGTEKATASLKTIGIDLRTLVIVLGLGLAIVFYQRVKKRGNYKRF